MEFVHKSVLFDEAIKALDLNENKIIVDGTAGGGGHSGEIAKRAKRVISIDQDPDAIAVLNERLGDKENVTIVHDNYSNIKNIISNLNIEKIDGLLLDLGVSSFQLDTAERGFSFHKDAPLDMRMSKSGLSAYDVVNNYDWIKDINTLDFLRDYGKFFNVNYMLDKDIVRRRLDAGITYTEFSYMILQALDFKYLHEHNNVDLQCAGSDQWGNITAGIDLIRKKTGQEVYGFTMPLILDKFGNKFGKSEGNALWLDKNKTSPYEIYQYLVNTDDSKVVEYLKVFTFLSHEEINKLEEKVKTEPEKREAQKALASEVVRFLHGEEELQEAIKLTECLFTGNVKELTDEEIEMVFKGMPTIETKEDTIINIMTNNDIASSKREAREFLSNNAITLDGEIINDENYIITNNKKNHIIRRGKKKYYLIKIN